jgi:Protein of unknown function (DUF3047)
MNRTSIAGAATFALALGLVGPAVADEHAAGPASPAPGPHVAWSEHFGGSLDWLDPFDHGKDKLARVYSVQHEDGLTFLRARHDFTAPSPPPAMHFGHAFQTRPTSLDQVRALTWKWRARKHPPVGKDAWQDMAGGVYVVIKQPSLLVGGKGFKFGWLAKAGEKGTHQHGLLQVELRHDPAGDTWRAEAVDLCALFQQEYGPCEGQKVLYIGVVTDADGTKSVAEADYADFELLTK